MSLKGWFMGSRNAFIQSLYADESIVSTASSQGRDNVNPLLRSVPSNIVLVTVWRIRERLRRCESQWTTGCVQEEIVIVSNGFRVHCDVSAIQRCNRDRWRTISSLESPSNRATGSFLLICLQIVAEALRVAVRYLHSSFSFVPRYTFFEQWFSNV